ncbi:sushi, von Willebrand factor type A, EGF and pentraxin domain-containing protein 1 [Elysia marginata]|uniref:Sushi, von Willebrand factor type A, EGF and pentraxin domain-containing protein 1 n=1 Tax=Elysia marginata TaxID=1093978 RepID=A0AAV4GJQ6_9GAST|nr:sushi, von Willebrand factor type A, EGF and pentraxin domain-containing protein 1 [Elysia marginata]
MRFDHQGCAHCVAVVVLLTTTGLNGQPADTEGWTGVSVDNDRRVIGAETFVDLTASNARQCLRMCWLFRACAALTFTLVQKRCQLFVLSGSDVGAYRLSVQAGSQSVDMRRAKIDTRLVTNEFCKGDPPYVQNTHTERDNVGSVIYTCAHGYFRTGTSHISKCDRATRAWSQVDTVCSLVNCGPPPSVTGALATGSGTTADSVVTYTCLTGAIPSSPLMTSTCIGSSADWSPVPGLCSVVSCGQPPPLDTMDVELKTRSLQGAFPGLDGDELAVAFGGEALYTCKQGYTTPEDATYVSQCQADGSWSARDHFRCSPVDCGPPPSVTNARPPEFTATTFAATATISCLPGYGPVENITLVCNESASWEGPEMTCEQVDCGPPPSVTNARPPEFTATTFAATATISCLPEYGPVENITLVCNESASWEGPEMTCEQVDCGPPPRVDFATLNVNSSSTSDAISTLAGSVVNYTCLAVAIPVSAEHMTSTCDASTGQWSPVPPPCTLVICEIPPAVDNAVVMLKARPLVGEIVASMETQEILRAYGGEAVYSCDDGYTPPEGATYISQCQADGNWSFTSGFACSPVDCDQPPQLANGSDVNQTNTTFGAQVTVFCRPGFSPVAGIPFRCNASGEWETTAQDVGCRLIECGEPTPVDNATLKYNSTNVASTAHYSCIEPAVSTGEENATAVCQEDGQWSNVSISCLAVPCGAAPEVAHSSVRYTFRHGQFEAHYVCDDGYQMVHGMKQEVSNSFSVT